ncbi:hypothetical protein MTO96_032733 [Rhipicephalus appendiculatus]
MCSSVQDLTFSSELSYTDDIVDIDLPWNTTLRAALTAETEEYTTDFVWSEPKKPKGELPIDAKDPALYRWVVTCETPECMMQTRWVTYLIQKQVNPCWETNAFVCDGTPLPTMEQPIPTDANDTSGGLATISPLPGDKNIIRRRTTQSTTQEPYPTDKTLYTACLKYLSQRDDGVNTVRQFMAQFGLDLGSIDADWKGDLMYTMTQLSFEYGVHSLLAMNGTFSLVADPARPFIMMVRNAG